MRGWEGYLPPNRTTTSLASYYPLFPQNKFIDFKVRCQEKNSYILPHFNRFMVVFVLKLVASRLVCNFKLILIFSFRCLRNSSGILEASLRRPSSYAKLKTSLLGCGVECLVRILVEHKEDGPMMFSVVDIERYFKKSVQMQASG